MIRLEKIGRMGNNLLQNVGVSILSKKLNLKVDNYINEEQFHKIGLSLNKEGLIKQNYKKYYDSDLEELLSIRYTNNCGIIYDGTFQYKNFLLNYRKDILDHFSLNYEFIGNNDAFIHVRLGDVPHVNPGLDYYIKALNNINFNKGYISSDSMDHHIVMTLIKQFNLTPIYMSPIDTINFGKNFNNIILSGGTFSWWIGFLSKAKNIIYPSITPPKWHGDIFVYDEWIGIEPY